MNKEELLKLKKEQLVDMLLDEIKRTTPKAVSFKCPTPDYESEYYKLIEFRKKYYDLLVVLGKRELDILSLEKRLNEMFEDYIHERKTNDELREKINELTKGKENER